MKHGWKADAYSHRMSSYELSILLAWVGASFTAKDAQPEDAKTARVMCAFTHYWLLRHFKCYTIEASEGLSLADNRTGSLITELRELCEDQAPDFMTPELADALLRVYQVHQQEFRAQFHNHERERHNPNWKPVWYQEEDKKWILKLHDERERSSAVRVFVDAH